MSKLLRFRPGGIAEEWDAYGNVTEMHTSTCSHCQHITNVPSLRRLHEVTDICRQCMKLICLECVGKPCIPFEKEAERQEARGRFLRDIGLD
jgi:hypothetical protein